ncbi:mitochondrial ous recombination protein 1 [Zygosaccharomyces mellis]|uniref:Large ribosomal subunit protein mL67 n=1 Tax=Zygosaccharomyces mellis TaxID=42258 RepID=A0A4C2DZ18_9SACH|nr:mitochondrial ous recombination protein 1 [Zygosaccharomyces mellis]
MPRTYPYWRVSKFRPATWLEGAGYAPQVFVFRNLETGQVLYSQFPNFTQQQVNKQYQRTDWSNRKPATRRDIWRCMCVVDMPTYESGVKLYQNLCRLKYLRDVRMPQEAQKYRKLNEDGHIWYNSQYRPTYTQEAVADLRESISKSGCNNHITIHWEDPWRMGDKSKYWTPILPGVQHSLMSRVGNIAREQSSVLRELGDKARQEFQKARKGDRVQQESQMNP